ncbi:MFS transporter [Falsibacillus albus]|uniref:MFS transporter n=1 Tax=Falsibacillus albus TaxID=2478915 RepID=A0A3L7JW61_9BACI|nr:MFS transporter [Falsibacillus albus]RLQ94494.1 MFS transporter [Falsibacillus albus]
MKINGILSKNVIRQVQHNKPLLFLWLASICSGLSISIYLLCEQWYVLKRLHMTESLGLILMATTLPRVIFMMFGGVAADYVRRSRIIFFSLLVRGLLILSMFLLLTIGQLQFWQLFVFAFSFGSIDAFFWPARDSLLPSLVHKHQLTRANSLIQTTSQITTLIGPLIGAFLLSLLSFKGVFITISILLITGSLFALNISDRRIIDQPGKDVSIFVHLKTGFQYVRRSPLLLALMLTFIIDNFFFIGPLMLSIPVMADEKFGGSAVHLSLLQSAFAAGMLSGAVLSGLINLRNARGRTVILLIMAEGAGLIFLSGAPFLWMAAIILFLIGMAISSINIPVASLIQETTDQEKMGRVMSLTTMVSIGFIPLSYAGVSALMTSRLSIYRILLIGGTVLLLYGFFLWVKARSLKDAS